MSYGYPFASDLSGLLVCFYRVSLVRGSQNERFSKMRTWFNEEFLGMLILSIEFSIVARSEKIYLGYFACTIGDQNTGRMKS